MCHDGRVTMPDETTTGDGIILMGDPRVTAVPVSDNGEELIDVRDHGLRVSTFRADDSGDFALVRAGLAARLLQAAELLPRGSHLLLIEGYRPPALQRRYFDDYLSSLREASPGSDEAPADARQPLRQPARDSPAQRGRRDRPDAVLRRRD